MSGALFLGWRYLAYHKLKTSILLASITLDQEGCPLFIIQVPR